MKKYMTMLALLIICQVGYSQKNVEQLFREFAKAENTEGVKLGKLFMNFAGLFTETMGVDGIEAYSFDNCTGEVKERLTKAMRNLKDSKYETMMTANEGNSRTKVLVRIEKEMIREMIVVTTGDSNALVRIKGKIKPSDIERVVEKHGKGEC
ncbi:MAG: DUF4252 domain-containing protein [Tannerellaceae bacterium]|jgi:hypothetical protein|nr:DUF4252 domain-containing protein [Tannerellaceae bacterium]